MRKQNLGHILLFMPVIAAVTPINTSLATLPVGYFGGNHGVPRSSANLDMLSRMRLVSQKLHSSVVMPSISPSDCQLNNANRL